MDVCDVSYRSATVDDSLNLANLLWEMITEEELNRMNLDLDDHDLKNEYISACNNHIKHRLGTDLYCFIAEANGLIVSHIFILITQKMPKLGRPNASYARLSSVRTINEYRNKGIGSVLMEHVVIFCKEKNAEEIIVWPSKKSVRFYENAGFSSENKIMEIDFFD